MKIQKLTIAALIQASSFLSLLSPIYSQELAYDEENANGLLIEDEDLIIGTPSKTVEASAEFDHWLLQHSKHYASEDEKRARLKNWLATNDKIRNHNKRYSAGAVSWYMKHNEYSDMTPEEFSDYFHLNNKVDSLEGVLGGLLDVEEDNSEMATTRRLRGEKALKDEFQPLDYESLGFVTPAKNQGGCGSCWAFASVGALESVRAKYLDESELLTDEEDILIALSEQEMVDCADSSTGNFGCSGGWPKTALSRYTSKQGSVCSAEDYPYEAKDNKGCRSSNCEHIPYTSFGTCTYVNSVRSNERSAINVDAALNESVLIIAMIVEPYGDWMSYGGGIYSDPACGSDSYTPVNHALLLVGRGVENGNDYWKLKNSWGQNWGEDGFIRFERQWDLQNNDGVCGMLRYVMKISLDIIEN